MRVWTVIDMFAAEDAFADDFKVSTCKAPLQGGGHAWEVAVSDSDGRLPVALMASHRAAKALRRDILRVRDERRAIEREPLERDEDRGERPPIAVGSFIDDPRDVHPVWREDFTEALEPPSPVCQYIRLPDGVDLASIFGFDRYAKQRQFLASRRRNCLFVGGRGTGKSHALGISALICALQNPGAPGLLLSRSYNELHAVLLERFWVAVRLFKAATGVDVVASHNKSLQVIHLINGASIYLRSWDRVDRVRSYDVAWICLDEIEHGQADPIYAYQTIGACLRHPAAEVPQFRLATTPNGLAGVCGHFLTKQRAERDIPHHDRRHHVTRATVFDNPYVDDDYREQLRGSMSPAQWRQEGLGLIVAPAEKAYVSWDESRHVVPWTWQRGLPWIHCVDWGESHFYQCQIQVAPDQSPLNPYGYIWVVAWEQKLEDIGPMDAREAVADALALRGIDRGDGQFAPVILAADRALPEQNRWVRSRWRGRVKVVDCWSRNDQEVRRGMTMVDFMLDPPDVLDDPLGGPKPALLYVSDELSADISNRPGMGLRGAMVNLRRRRTRDGQLLDEVERNTLASHPTDALRYGVVCSKAIPRLHGGQVLRAAYDIRPARVA